MIGRSPVSSKPRKNPRSGTTCLVQEVVHSAVFLCGAGSRDVLLERQGLGRRLRGAWKTATTCVRACVPRLSDLV